MPPGIGDADLRYGRLKRERPKVLRAPARPSGGGSCGKEGRASVTVRSSSGGGNPLAIPLGPSRSARRRAPLAPKLAAQGRRARRRPRWERCRRPGPASRGSPPCSDGPSRFSEAPASIERAGRSCPNFPSLVTSSSGKKTARSPHPPSGPTGPYGARRALAQSQLRETPRPI